MKYGKKPITKRYRLQRTSPGRSIRKATVERRRDKRKERPMRRGRVKRAYIR